jgi:hypothetical protein
MKKWFKSLLFLCTGSASTLSFPEERWGLGQIRPEEGVKEKRIRI